MKISRQIADFKRFKEIVGVLFEEGFSVLVENTKLRQFVPMGARKKKKAELETNPERLRRVLERLGPTFIKFGQILSVRPDLVPKEYIFELEKLQDSVAEISYEEVKKVVEKSTGKKIGSIFKKFDKEPVAAASIAQVHRAILKNNRVVAVKVKRPGISDILGKDMEIMYFLARLLAKHVKAARKFRPVDIVDEFSVWTKRELDFVIEAENIKQFYKNFEDSDTTKIPLLFEEHCTSDILVMEFIKGTSLDNIKRKPVNLRAALTNGFYSMMEQVFVHGMFHADPHPSNFFIMADNRICFVDFGIIGSFDEAMKEMIRDIFVGVIRGDSEAVVENLIEISSPENDIDRDFNRKINELLYPIRSGRIRDVKVSLIISEILDVSLHYGLRVPKEFVLFGKAIVTMEGIALEYYPDFRLSEVIEPFVKRLLIEKYEPIGQVKKGIRNFMGMKKTLEKLPDRAERVLKKLEQGKIQLEMHDTDIQKLSVKLDKSSNRLTYAMIIAALLISGSLVINVGGPVFFGLPFISSVCFGMAAFFAFVLFFSIMREDGS